MERKPTLAVDWKEKKLKFPLMAQPKIDGVRGLNFTGNLTGRSLNPLANLYTTAYYSRPWYKGFDGEFAAEKETHPDLCRITTSAVNSIQGTPYTLWHIFDYVNEETIDLPYKDRYDLMCKTFHALPQEAQEHLRIVPSVWIENLQQLMDFDDWCLAEGYEGTILRNPNAKHKEDRSTQQIELWRIKRFLDGEILVDEIIEGEENQNEPTTNALGKTERSSHQENKIPNGMLGSMMGIAQQDIIDPSTKLVVIKKGERIKVGAGKMTHDKRKEYFDNPSLIIGHVIKYKFFPKGIKDKPRFPTYTSHRAPQDM